MKKTSRVMSLLLAGAMALSMTACGSSKAEEAVTADTKASEVSGEAESSKDDAGTTAAAAEDGKTYKIGILQLVQHPALDATNKGFLAALDEAGIKYEVNQQNASGDQSTCQTMANTLVNNGQDLILAIATPAAQAVVGLTEGIPVLVTAVTDPAESGLVDSNEVPGNNVSGTSDLTPVKEQMDLMKQILPDVKTVGLLYCSAESNSVLQIDMAKKSLDEAGIAYKDYTVSSSNEIQTVVESMLGKVDAIYTPTDNMIAAGMATVAMVANDNKIPVICGEGGMVDQGGLATYGIDYYQLGYMTGQQAIEILTKGADISKMPIGYLPIDKCELSVNEETAEKLGVDVSGLK